MTKTKFTPDQKIQIVLESIKAGIGTTELCCRHNVHPQTFQARRQKFLDAGKAGLSRYGKSDPVRAIKKENGDLKHIIGELTIANDALKKPWRQTEIERGQADAGSAEPAPVLGVCGRLKEPVIL